MKLRTIQNKAVDAVFSSLDSNASTLMVCPTGFGKTICMASIISRKREMDKVEFPSRKPGLAMVIAHREELITQAVDKITRVTGLQCDIEMAEKRAYVESLTGETAVIVSSVQTQNSGQAEYAKRMTRFNPLDFSLLLVDEAHHATSGTYRKIIDYYAQNPRLKIVGVTATPDRSDEEALGQVFQSVAFDYQIIDAINDGWLVDIRQRVIDVEELDFSAMRTTAGDLNGGDLARMMEQEKILHGIASPALEVIGDKRAICFTASVAQAEMLCEIFNRHKPDMAAWICGKTDKDSRREILSRFSKGGYQIVCNCGVLTEGFDDSGVEYIIMARPTKSRSLYAQMAGRAIRPHDDIAHDLNDCDDAESRRKMIRESKKPVCEVIDFVGNAGRHKLMTTADILGGKHTDEALKRALANIKKSKASGRIQDEIQKAEDEIEAEIKAAEEKKILDRMRKQKLVAKAKYHQGFINPFDVLQIKPQPERGWDQGKELSEKQMGILNAQGVNISGLSYTESKQILNEIFRRFRDNECSYKQAMHLVKHGYTGHESREEASKILSRLWGR